MCRDAYAANSLRGDAVSAMSRFSFTGHFVVAAVVATGMVNIALVSGHPPLPPTTPYRALLDIKISLVAVMILLAVFNRYVLTPRLKADATALAALRAPRTPRSAKLATSTAKCVRTHLERDADQGRAEACVLRPGFVCATLARRLATGH